jgi:hypothetical protein
LVPFGEGVSGEKLLGQMEPNLAGSIYARYSIKPLHLVPFGQQTWPPRAILFSDSKRRNFIEELI